LMSSSLSLSRPNSPRSSSSAPVPGSASRFDRSHQKLSRSSRTCRSRTWTLLSSPATPFQMGPFADSDSPRHGRRPDLPQSAANRTRPNERQDAREDVAELAPAPRIYEPSSSLHRVPQRLRRPNQVLCSRCFNIKCGAHLRRRARSGAVEVAAGFVVPVGEDERMAIGKLKTVVLDAPDITRVSAFYSELAGWTQKYADHEWITMTTDDGWRIGLQSARNHVPPQWPDASHPQQAHLDLRVPDLAAGTQKAIELGAKLLRENERWNTLTDPAGHPFDLCLAENNEMTPLMGVMLDCPAAKLRSAFYSDLLGRPVTYEGEGVAMIGEDGAQPVMFQQIENYQAPWWPDPAYPQQFHFDVTVHEIEAAEQGVLAL